MYKFRSQQKQTLGFHYKKDIILNDLFSCNSSSKQMSQAFFFFFCNVAGLHFISLSGNQTIYLLKLIKKLEALILTFIYNSSTVSWHQTFRETFIFIQERQSMTLSQNQIGSSFLNMLASFLFSAVSAATVGAAPLLGFWST